MRTRQPASPTTNSSRYRYSQSIIECRRSMYGITIGGVKMNIKMWPMRKSELQSDSSMIFTTNSRAGCDIACAPKPRPYHLPVHHARFVSSCLNSRERKTEMRILLTARWMKMIVMRPSTACATFQSSKNHYMWCKLSASHSICARRRHLRRTRRTRSCR